MRPPLLLFFVYATAILSVHENAVTVYENLQNYLNHLQYWLRKWKIKIYDNKSALQNEKLVYMLPYQLKRKSNT